MVTPPVEGRWREADESERPPAGGLRRPSETISMLARALGGFERTEGWMVAYLGSSGASDKRHSTPFDSGPLAPRGVQKLDRHAAAAILYSRMRPPSRSRRLT